MVSTLSAGANWTHSGVKAYSFADRSVVSGGGWRMESKPRQVIFRPAGLQLDHGFQGLDSESIPTPVIRNRDPPAVGLTIMTVSAGLPSENEAISDQRAD